MKYDCAVITSFITKSEKNVNIFDNLDNHKALSAAILYLKYGLIKVKGSYIENYLVENSIDVKEHTYFVISMNNDVNFIENIVKIGELFCQNSVLIMEKGGENNYVFGTNYGEFPPYQSIDKKGNFSSNREAEMGKPFILEMFKNYQINSKYIITKWGKPIVDYIESKKTYGL